MYILKDYQSKVVYEGLVPHLSSLANRVEVPGRLAVLSAPTGSGKTVMLSAALGAVGGNVATIWLSPGKGDLHEQSYRSVSSNLSGTALEVELLDEDWLSANTSINPGTVLFASWESLNQRDGKTGKRKNVVTREGEKRNIFEVLTATADEGTPLLVIVDESHWGAEASGTTELLEAIDNCGQFAMRVEASATPTSTVTLEGVKNGTQDEFVVDFDDVREAGMVSNEILINPGLRAKLDAMSDEDRDSTTGESLVLDAAWSKLQELKQAFVAAGSPVRPLMLVQIPDSKAGDDKLTAVEKFMKTKGVDRDNERLAVWLSKDKTDNLDGISEFDSPAEVLVFKQAVATGWDCPRAQVLVGFREIQSQIFEVQTTGRILRTPERCHYGDSLLDAAYIFANIEATWNPRQEKDNDEVEVKDVNLSLSSTVAPFSFQGSYASRAGTYNDLDPKLFRKCFNSAAEETQLAKDLPHSSSAAQDVVLSDWGVTTGDILDGDDYITSSGEDSVVVSVSEADLNKELDALITSCLGGYVVARSLPRVRRTLKGWFETHMSGWCEEGVLDHRALGEAARNHSKLLKSALSLAVEAHKEEQTSNAHKSKEEFSWTLLPELMVSSKSHSSPHNPAGYIYHDSRALAWRPNANSSPEKLMEQHLAALHSEGAVKWWFKNGTGDKSYFSVTYTNSEGLLGTFYPDYVVELSAGETGKRRFAVLETKSVADKDVETKLKAAALQDFFNESTGEEFEVSGGIVVHLEGDTFMVNSGGNYSNPRPSSLTDKESGWEKLSL